ncbi:MAG: SDR family oxidoreductase [Deltaproteobacteria bacterium]|nr:SDR family oxidoreductase [Deltaproteobacteria bacterium]
MGPAIAALFAEEGADVISVEGRLSEAPAREAAVEAAQDVDVLVANLALEPRHARLNEIEDDDWQALFDALVHPLMCLVRSAAPAMLERGSGKIVAVTSAAPLRGIPGVSAYCAARGAQNSFIRAAGLELAPGNVQVNAIAQNYVRNDTYYPESLVESDRFAAHLKRNVPIQRLAEARETAELALFLASEKSNFVVGQVIPFAGGWVTTTG